METRVDLAIRSWVAVDASTEWAFDVFTRDIGEWWPLGTHSKRASLGLGRPDRVRLERWEEGRLYEQTADELLHWATVVTWDPPTRVGLEWLVNPQSPPTNVEVTFTPENEHTRVEVEHSGWEFARGWGLADTSADDLRARFAGPHGWEWVLGHYAVAVGA
jgi:hypothetical protein